MTADEIQNAYGKYGGQYMKMGGSILEKYRLENCSVQFSLFLMRETEGLDDKERLKALYRIRKDILSGKLKVPGEGVRLSAWPTAPVSPENLSPSSACSARGM